MRFRENTRNSSRNYLLLCARIMYQSKRRGRGIGVRRLMDSETITCQLQDYVSKGTSGETEAVPRGKG